MAANWKARGTRDDPVEFEDEQPRPGSRPKVTIDLRHETEHKIEIDLTGDDDNNPISPSHQDTQVADCKNSLLPDKKIDDASKTSLNYTIHAADQNNISLRDNAIPVSRIEGNLPLTDGRNTAARPLDTAAGAEQGESDIPSPWRHPYLSHTLEDLETHRSTDRNAPQPNISTQDPSIHSQNVAEKSPQVGESAEHIMASESSGSMSMSLDQAELNEQPSAILTTALASPPSQPEGRKKLSAVRKLVTAPPPRRRQSVTYQVEQASSSSPELSLHSTVSNENAQQSSSAQQAKQSKIVVLRTVRFQHAQEAVNNSPQEMDSPIIQPTIDPPLIVGSVDITLTIDDIGHSLQRQLDTLEEEHAISVRNVLRRQRTSLDRDVKSKKRSGAWSPSYTPTIGELSTRVDDPFADMATISFATSKKSLRLVAGNIAHDIFPASRSGGGGKTQISAPITTIKSNAVTVPSYREYVHLQKSVLVENNTKLLYWPYWGDEDDKDPKKAELWAELRERYEMLYENDPDRLLRKEQHLFYGPYVEVVLEDLRITWDHIFYWFLARVHEVKSILGDFIDVQDQEFRTLLDGREPHNQTFNRSDPMWTKVLARIAKPSARMLWVSATLCSIFQDRTGISMWHLARQSERADYHMLGVMQDTQETQKHDTVFTYGMKTCRVCHEYDCPFHGEITEEPASGDEAEPGEKQSLQIGTHREDDQSDREHGSNGPNSPQNLGRSTALEHWDPEDGTSASNMEIVINYKKMVNLPHRGPRPSVTKVAKKTVLPFSIDYWIDNSVTHKMDKRRPFRPCSHEGSCKRAQCRCYREKIMCEKTCGCSSSCSRRFPGCSCKILQRGRVCGGEKCECRRLNRECDADLCGSCGASEVLDPSNRYDYEGNRKKCRNVNIQSGTHIRTLLGQSTVHGFGLFTGEDAKRDDYIGEYVGEVITTQEANRRGSIYTYEKTNYLFKLTERQEIDSTRAGNKTRFINDAKKALTNCEAKVLLCNSVARIGLFAKVDIKAGTELFFHYGYPAEMTKYYVQPGQAAEQPLATQKKSLASKKERPDEQTGLRKMTRSATDRPAQTDKTRAAKAALQVQNAVTQPQIKSIKQPLRKTTAKVTIVRPGQSLTATSSSKTVTNEHTAISSSSTRSFQLGQVVQETDAEDEEYVTDNDGEVEDDDDDDQDPDSFSVSDFDVPATDSEESSDDNATGGGSKLRNSLGGMVEEQKLKRKESVASRQAARQLRRETRESRVRKRKRVVVDDDSEEL